MRSRRTKRCSSAPARRCRDAGRSWTSSRTRRTKWCSRTPSIAATSSTPTRRGALAQKVGYAPAPLADFLTRLADRNKDQAEKNGLFASHPETKERIDKIRQLAGSKTGAMGAARYAATIKYQPTEITTDRRRRRRIGRPRGLERQGKRSRQDQEAGGAAEERLRSWRAEADGRARETERAGVGIGRSPRSRTGSSGEGRRESEPGEGHRVGRRARRLQEGYFVA